MKEARPVIPVTLLCGYLGSGKTTAINSLLRNATGGRRILVLVNDFGELSIDSELIERRHGDTLTLANGCICCSVGGQFMRALTQALELTPPPEHIVIEASGVAEPRRIADIARAEPDLRLDCVATMIDANAVRGQLADPHISGCVTRQISDADLLIINKADLVSSLQASELLEYLKPRSPNAQAIVVSQARVSQDLLLEPHTVPVAVAPVSHDASEMSHETQYVRWSYESCFTCAPSRLKEALAELPQGVLRLKGIVDYADGSASVLVNVVGRRTELAQAPSSNGRSGTRLVAIGLRACLNTLELDEFADRYLSHQS